MWYRICPYCGAALDPAELCDCERPETDPAEAQRIAEREAKIKALREDLRKCRQEKQEGEDRARQIEILRKQLQAATGTNKSA